MRLCDPVYVTDLTMILMNASTAVAEDGGTSTGHQNGHSYILPFEKYEYVHGKGGVRGITPTLRRMLNSVTFVGPVDF